jgi:vacuolar protein sorting-associated protein 26
MVRVTIVRQYGNNITQNFRFWVRNVQAPPEVNNSIKMEVGIEDCLHIEFEYAKSKYSLKARARALLRFGVCVCSPEDGTR